MSDAARDEELAAALAQAFPAPSPERVDQAWREIALGRRVRRRPLRRFLARAAGLTVLIAASYAAGYMVGRTGRQAPGAGPAAFPVRPPELLPPHAVGGVP